MKQSVGGNRIETKVRYSYFQKPNCPTWQARNIPFMKQRLKSTVPQSTKLCYSLATLAWICTWTGMRRPPPFEHWCLSSKSLLQDTKHSPHHMALHREGLEGTVSGIVLRAEAALVRTSTTNLQEKDVMPLIFGILFHKSLCQILTFCYIFFPFN